MDTPDILCYILSYCDEKDLFLRCTRVCKQWNTLITSGRIFILEPWWKKKRDISKFLNYIEIYIKEEKWNLALIEFSRALNFDPRNIDLLCRRAEFYKTRKMYESAIKEFITALKIKENCEKKYYYNIYSNLGYLYNILERYEEACLYNSKALELDPKDIISYNNRGYALHSMGKYKESIKDYENAIKIDPCYNVAFNNIGYSYQKLGNYEKALYYYSESIRLNPKNIKALNNRGVLYMELGKLKESINDFERSLTIDPTCKITSTLKQTVDKKIKENYI